MQTRPRCRGASARTGLLTRGTAPLCCFKPWGFSLGPINKLVKLEFLSLTLRSLFLCMARVLLQTLGGVFRGEPVLPFEGKTTGRGL